MADCEYSVPDKNISGDALYGPRICNQPFVDWAWNQYKFDFDYWQDGWGWDDCCNTSKPLARTFEAIWALDYSSDNPWDESYDHQNMLFWGGRYVRERLASGYVVRALCGSSVVRTFGAGCISYRNEVIWDCTEFKDKGYKACDKWDKDCCDWIPCSWVCKLFTWICVAFHWVANLVCVAWGWVASWFCVIGTVFDTKRIELYNTAYFYNQDVAERASTFIHECRHTEGRPHTAKFPAGSVFGAGGDGADVNWAWNGAWRWEVCWLAWYGAAAKSSSTALMVRARGRANVMIDNAFAEHPGFNV